jgi:hypothetical protein
VPTYDVDQRHHWRQTSLGKASLWASIAGIVVPVLLAIVLVIWVLLFVPQGRMGPSYEDSVRLIAGLVLCVVVFMLLELVAFGCGMAARYTTTGKIGLAISCVLLTLALVVTTFILYRSDFFKV